MCTWLQVVAEGHQARNQAWDLSSTPTSHLPAFLLLLCSLLPIFLVSFSNHSSMSLLKVFCNLTAFLTGSCFFYSKIKWKSCKTKTFSPRQDVLFLSFQLLDSKQKNKSTLLRSIHSNEPRVLQKMECLGDLTIHCPGTRGENSLNQSARSAAVLWSVRKIRALDV